MKICKYCRLRIADEYMSKPDKNACSNCYSAAVLCRKELLVGKFTDKSLWLRELWDKNIDRAPSWYKDKDTLKACSCERCGKDFKSYVKTVICQDCVSIDTKYRALLAANRTHTKRFKELHTHYATMLSQGYFVPQIFHKNRTLY